MNHVGRSNGFEFNVNMLETSLLRSELDLFLGVRIHIRIIRKFHRPADHHAANLIARSLFTFLPQGLQDNGDQEFNWIKLVENFRAIIPGIA